MLQFHDYHGVVSLMYLSEAAKPSVMYVAHNADYNGAWALGSPARERYLYSMFNLPISRETRMCAALLTCLKPQTLQLRPAYQLRDAYVLLLLSPQPELIAQHESPGRFKPHTSVLVPAGESTAGGTHPQVAGAPGQL